MKYLLLLTFAFYIFTLPGKKNSSFEILADSKDSAWSIALAYTSTKSYSYIYFLTFVRQQSAPL